MVLYIPTQVEDLRQIYLEHSRGRKKIDILGYRKLLAYFGVVSKDVPDRVFEIYDTLRGMPTAVA
jgi:spore maturation protein CgeB